MRMQLKLSYADLKEFSIVKIFDMIDFYIQMETQKTNAIKGKSNNAATVKKTYSVNDMEADW